MRIIKNVIFDIGRVLLEYEPLDYLNKRYDAQKADGLMNLVYRSREWLDCDRGRIDFMSLYGIFSKKRPEWSDDLKFLLNRESMLNILMPKRAVIDFFYELKAEGYKMFLLSNFSNTGFAWMEEAYPVLGDADGRIISSHVKLMKPEPEIYKLLLHTYGLLPGESAFIDDDSDNVRGAAELGIRAIQFTDIESCRGQLRRLTAGG